VEEERCQFGHLLATGSDSITLKEIDPATGRLLKEEKRLLRRHVNTVMPPRPLSGHGMVPVECLDGLLMIPVEADGKPQHRSSTVTDGYQTPFAGGQSWMRAQYARGVHCVICLGIEVIPPDIITPRDGSFTPREQDLPAWAR